jgi:hypothetical protein
VSGDIFTPAIIANAVHQNLDGALASIPAGQKGAVLTHVSLANGQPTGGLTVVEKVGDHWAVGGDISFGTVAGHLDPAVGFSVKGSW